MAQLDAQSEELARAAYVAELIYRVAIVLRKERDWSDGNGPSPEDALRLAHFLTDGPYG